jgi:hypothetical protein
MSDNLVFKYIHTDAGKEFNIKDWDDDKEIEFVINSPYRQLDHHYFLSVEQVKELASFLTEKLKTV